MDLEFKNKDLVKLYTTGKSAKYKISTPIAELFVRRIFQLELACSIDDVKNTSFLNFQKISDDTESYRIDICDNCYLEFEISWDDQTETKGKFFITELLLI